MEKLKNMLGIGKKAEDILVVGGAGQETVSTPPRRGSSIAFYASMLFLGLTIFASYTFTGSLLDEREYLLREKARLVAEKMTAQKNLESLQQLSKEVGVIREQQERVEQAIPFDPHYEQVVSFLEYQVNQIKKQYYLETPENISWRPVSESDVSNDDLKDLEIYQFTFSLHGSYDALLLFLQQMRDSLRLIDVRSVSNFRLDEFGNAGADFMLWTYSIPL